MIYFLIFITLAGHYKLRKQIPVLAWTYSVLLPLIMAAALFYAFHVIS